jgi:hypothetical protein
LSSFSPTIEGLGERGHTLGFEALRARVKNSRCLSRAEARIPCGPSLASVQLTGHGGSYGVTALVEKLACDVEHWGAACESWPHPGSVRDRKVKETERNLLIATGALLVGREPGEPASPNRHRTFRQAAGEGSPSHAGGGGSAVRPRGGGRRIVGSSASSRPELTKASRQMGRFGAVGAAAGLSRYRHSLRWLGVGQRASKGGG